MKIPCRCMGIDNNTPCEVGSGINSGFATQEDGYCDWCRENCIVVKNYTQYTKELENA